MSTLLTTPISTTAVSYILLSVDLDFQLESILVRVSLEDTAGRQVTAKTVSGRFAELDAATLTALIDTTTALLRARGTIN